MAYKVIIGKTVDEVHMYPTEYGCTIFLSGGDIQIKRGYYSWRLCHEGQIIMASADLFALVPNLETTDFWPIACEEPDTIEYEEYQEYMFEQLEEHWKSKMQAASGLLEGKTITDCKVNAMHDLTICFSNGAVLEVTALMNINKDDKEKCNSIAIYETDSEPLKTIWL